VGKADILNRSAGLKAKGTMIINIVIKGEIMKNQTQNKETMGQLIRMMIPNEYIWWSDSGANKHYTGHKHWYVDYRKYAEPRDVTLPDNKQIKAEGEGTILIEALINQKWKKARIDDVMYIPGGVNLFSEYVMAKKGYVMVKDEHKTIYRLKPNNEPRPEAYGYGSGWAMAFAQYQSQQKRFQQERQLIKQNYGMKD